MFYTIHRVIKGLVICAALFVGWRIWENRAVFEPGWVWLDVWDNGGFRVEPKETTAGRVKRVVNSQTFTMAPRKGLWVNVRLMGLKDPAQEVTVEGKEKERVRKEALEAMILDRWVHVELLYANEQNLGGIVYAGGTNINAEMVRLGHAKSSREMVKTFPKEAQYSMLWAIRNRVEEKR